MTERTIHLHESTRRSLCRWAFTVLGIVPLAFCIALAASTLIPGYSRRQAACWEQTLNQLCGLNFRVSQAQALAPFHYNLLGVELFHPETNRLMGSIEAMNLRLEQGKWAIHARNSRMQMDQLSEFCRTVHQWYICRPLDNRQRAIIELNEMTITNADQSAQLTNIVAELLPETNKWGLKVAFSHRRDLASNRESPENQLILVRNHSSEKSGTEIQLRVQSSLPLWLLSPAARLQPDTTQQTALEPMLARGQFAGVMDIRYNASGTSIYLTDASIKDLDLGQVGWQRQPLVSGIGNLLLTHAKLEPGGLRWAEGSFDLGPGRIDTVFFQSLVHFLQWEVPRQNPTETIAFDRMAARFRVQPESIQLIGGMADGTLFSDAHGSLAKRLDPSAMPVSYLVHALAASPGSDLLVRKALVWLPLDDTQRRETAQVLRIRRY